MDLGKLLEVIVLLTYNIHGLSALGVIWKIQVMNSLQLDKLVQY